MKIPRKTKYKIVNRTNIRPAVKLHNYRKSIIGLSKTDGKYVYGIELELGKYTIDDLIIQSYLYNDGVYLVPDISEFTFLTPPWIK